MSHVTNSLMQSTITLLTIHTSKLKNYYRTFNTSTF
uniref:Uncharacterized protein n=1 Tax=Arundo donax TaxID=35708 RepID=A0A0A8Z8X5_ARUDO